MDSIFRFVTEVHRHHHFQIKFTLLRAQSLKLLQNQLTLFFFFSLYFSDVVLDLCYEVKKGNVRYADVRQKWGGTIITKLSWEYFFLLSTWIIAVEYQQTAHRFSLSYSIKQSLKEIWHIVFLFNIPNGLTLSCLGVTNSFLRNRGMFVLGIPDRPKPRLPPNLHLFTVSWTMLESQN